MGPRHGPPSPPGGSERPGEPVPLLGMGLGQYRDRIGLNVEQAYNKVVKKS
jgi:hypothetical protein